MKVKSQKVYTDERTVQLEGKLGNELSFFAIVLLLISILIKIVFWQVPLEGYLPEILIILAMEIYTGIRSWQLGLDIRPYDSAKGVRTLRSRLVNGAVLAAVLVATQMLGRISALHPLFKQYPFLQFILILLLMATLSSLWDRLVHYFYQKRIREELDNGEED